MAYNSTNTGAEIQAKLDKIVAATTTSDGLMSATDKGRIDYRYGVSNVTTLVSVPTTYRLVMATLSAATTLSLSGTLDVGQELHIICTPTASFTQPIPNTGSWISMDGSSLAVTSGVPFELNILYDGTYYRIKVITQAS